MEVSGKRNTGSEDIDTGVLCDPCLLDEEHENAQSYCTECNEFLCEACINAHRKTKASRNHQLLKRDEMPRRKLTSVQPLCPKHDSKQIEYFCDVHTQFCCSVCVTLEHSQCGVAYINDIAKDFNTNKEYRDLLKSVKDLGNQIAEERKKSETNRDSISTYYNKMIKDIKTFREEINSKLDAMETKLIEEAQTIQSDDQKSMDSISELSETMQAELREMNSTFESLERYRQNTHLVIASKKAQDRVKEYNTQMREISQRNCVRVYAFQRNEDILGTLHSSDNLGTLEYRERKEREMKKEVQTRGGNIKREEDPKPVKARLVKKIKVKHIQDKSTCWITGSVLLTNDTLALADTWNNSVKVVDLQSDIITSYIKLTYKPFDITCIDTKTLVVTSDTKITFLNYSGKISIRKKIPMEAGYHGITYRNNKLFVTFTKQPSVKILDIDGNVLQTFKTDSQGRNPFVDPRYITVSEDGQTMYVSDFDQHTVTRLGMDSRVLNVYKHEHLKSPKGLTVGVNNSVYVAGWGSWNVHQITEQCRYVQQIVARQKDGLVYPQTVACNNTNNTMYICHGETLNSNILYVFKLE